MLKLRRLKGVGCEVKRVFRRNSAKALILSCDENVDQLSFIRLYTYILQFDVARQSSFCVVPRFVAEI